MKAKSAKALDAEVLFRVPSVYNYHVSPKNDVIAFSWNKTGQWQIHLKDIATGKSRQLTFGSESKISPSFSHHGRQLAYAQDYQGDENFDIFLINPTDGESWNLTPDTPEAVYPKLEWSPDGKKIAYASNRNGKFSIYAISTSGGDPEQISNHKYSDSDPEWSPDGKWLAFNSLLTAQEYGVFITRSHGGEILRLADNGEALEAASPDWSPDGKLIAFMSAERGSYDIGIWNRLLESVEWITEGTYECYDPRWFPDGRRLAYLTNRDGNVEITIWDRKARTTETLAIDAGVHALVDFGHDPEAMFFTYSGPTHPVDLWLADLRNREFHQVTNSFPATLERSDFMKARLVSYPSTDGLKIPSLLYLPKNFNSRNLGAGLVYIHGGPTAQQMNEWDPPLQYLANRGYVVIAPNYRGSTGYGRKFREANRFVLGQRDLDDVIVAAEYLVKQKLADPKRIGVLGGSYGGYLTMCALTKYPKMWGAGSAVVPFLNWFTEFENEREDLQFWDRENMGDPKKDYQRFRDASPIFFIDGVEAPVQLISGAHDPRCPVSETRQAQQELQKLGKVFDLIVYEDEGHGFRKLDNRVDAYKRQASFLDRHLSGKSQA
jgi:dipeptidyl aminopeptidase/acylaminoacyl peptidase